MIEIYLKPLHHRGKELIGIYFEKNALIQSLLQKHANAQWSRTQKCWHIPCAKESYIALTEAVAGKGTINREELDGYLRKKKTNPETSLFLKPPPLPPTSNQNTNPKSVVFSTGEEICFDNKIEFDKYKNQLVLKGYSKSTMRTYCGEFSVFLKVLNNTPAKEMTPELLQRYLLYCIEKLKLSENTIHSRINALYPVGLKKTI